MFYYPDIVPVASIAPTDTRGTPSKLSDVPESDVSKPMTQSPKIACCVNSFLVKKHMQLDAEVNIQVTKLYRSVTISIRCDIPSST